MKKLFAVLCTIFIALSGFAINGAMSGSKGQVKVIHLEHFDVIYAEEAEESGLKIAAVCEEYYKEISDYLAFDPQLFLPVTITRTVEQLNAYFTQVPYNRIVLFDTPPDSSLDMYKETLTQVFYHELTHAITMNMKSPFWQGLSAFFGDVITPSNINLTTFWDESATVCFESRGEGGRLNDSFATQLVTAAKVKNCFPDWRDVTGARDTYPGGNDAYYFGGMFARYLVEKYGIEKYSAFWQRAGRNPAIFSGSTTFKGTYEKSLDEEWKDFEESVYVPSQTEGEFEFSVKLVSHPQSFVQSCDVQDGKVVFFDSKSQGLFDEKNCRLLSCMGVESLRFCDEDELFVHRYAARDNTKYEPFIYSLKSGKITETDNPVKDSSRGLYSRIPVKDGGFFAIEKDGLDFYVVYLNDELKVEKRWNPGSGKKLILHNLHSGKNSSEFWNLTFTWTELGKGSAMVSRTGRMSVDKTSFTAKVELQSQDFAFGTTDYLTDGNVHYVVVQKYEEAPLYKIDLRGVLYDSFEIVPETEKENFLTVGEEKMSEFSPQNYFPLSYYTRGIFLPVSTTGILKSDFTFDEDASGFGASYISSNPWGDKLFSVTAGIYPDEAVYAAGCSLSGGNDSFTYQTGIHGNYYSVDSFGCVMGEGGVSKTLWTGLVSRTGFSAQVKGFYGKNNNYEDDDRKNFVILKEKAVEAKLGAFWTNTHKSKPQPYFIRGITFEQFMDWEYRKTEPENLINQKIEKLSYINCGASLTIRQPVFVPVSFTAAIFPERDSFAQWTSIINLADLEIQKGIPILPLYFDRMILSCIYWGSISYESGSWFDCKKTVSVAENLQWCDYEDGITAKLSFISSLNTGYFADSSSSFEFYGFYKYRINNPKEKDKHVWGINCAIAY